MRPKGDKTRLAPLPPQSFTGFDLHAALADRSSAAEKESRETGREALLFPAPRGGLWWHTAFDLYGADAGVLMALGGWENELTVSQRYYRSGREHTDRGLSLFSTSLGKK